MRLRRPAGLADVQVLAPAPWKRYVVIAIFIVVHSCAIQQWANTAGEPYEWALEEQKRTLREKAANVKEKGGVSFQSGKQDRKETEFEIDYEALPSKLLPSAWSCVFIFFSVSSHILFHLMCVWSVAFKAMALFSPSRRICQGNFVWATPHANKGKAAICRLEESEVTLKFTFVFQYQSFEYIEPEVAEKDQDLIGDSDAGGVQLVQSPVNLRWKDYLESTGLKTDTEVEKAQDIFGTNVFELPRPTFWQLYQKQLMSPLAIFQFFCTALWMLDTYWKYTCFTLISVLGFEASTAFQRLKSMATLRGMGNKSYSVYVFRQAQWKEYPIEELLPGDIVSLHTKMGEEKKAPTEEGGEGAAAASAAADRSELSVPCDCLLLRGTAIVNEATLTGESVPQMKDALGAAPDDDTRLDVFGKHRIHALFSGTSLIQATPAPRSLPGSSEEPKNGVGMAMEPPDKGIVCYVMRTGFNSSQGELMRMIEFSTEDVGSDKVETCLQLLFLLAFALVAAGYVLKKGLEDPTRPTYKTLLRCTLIITSVVPPSLPMQMAFAVHTALMSLVKSGIFCTEPFRVPFAGKVAYCFFDKTGTLTSDQMVAVGVVSADSKPSKSQKGSSPEAARELTAMKEASPPVAMVVAGCHSLIELDGKALGDPIEVAALRGVTWSYVPQTSTASPGGWRTKEQYIAKQRKFQATLRDDIEADKKEKDELAKKLEDLEKTLKHDRQEAKKLQVTIEQRYHFSSELQRMSTICRVASSGSSVPGGTYCLTKGSPEAIGKLVVSKPDWYEATYKGLAERGQRVLALGYRQISSDPNVARDFSQKPRDTAERELTFAGFISFKCETRKDSHLVIKALTDSKHACVMLTGDAPLTALSVAREVGISRFSSDKALILAESESEGLQWQPAFTAGKGSSVESRHFKPSELESLSAEHDLVVTGSGLEAALSGPDAETMRFNLHTIGIFARLSPGQKEQVIRAVRDCQKVTTMMCGDGGNDVGALKEAEVGLALLSGFGNANVGGGSSSGDGEGEGKEAKDALAVSGKTDDAEAALDQQRKEAAQASMAISKKANEEMARRRKELMSNQQKWVEEELEARRRRGEDVGFMGQMSAMKAVMNRLRTEIKKEQDAMQKKHGNAFAAGAAKFATDLDSMEEETPMVRLGDASTAAPFTTRTPSISSCVDIIRQGRCTLLSAVQQMEIMMLESMIAAYTMSTMSVDGTRPSEAQMMASGTLMSVASLAFSFARPLDRMHPVRPLSSVFHPAILFSMLGQLAVHLGCMVYIANLAREAMGEDAVKEILEFEKERNKHIESLDESTFDEWNWFMSVPFKNNLLNTCCWLVETSQQISVIFVNYKGRPWMKGLLENQPLFLSLFACIGMVAVCAWGVWPWLNEILNLEVVPEDLRPKVMITLLVSLVGSFVWDRLMVLVFAPHIFQAQVDEVKALKAVDFFPLLKTVGYVAGGAVFLFAGNPLVWLMGYMIYRNFKKAAPGAAGT